MSRPNPWTIPVLITIALVAGVIVFARQSNTSLAGRVQERLAWRGWDWVRYQRAGDKYDVPDNILVAKKGANLYVVLLNYAPKEFRIWTYLDTSKLPEGTQFYGTVKAINRVAVKFDEDLQITLFAFCPQELEAEVKATTKELAEAVREAMQ